MNLSRSSFYEIMATEGKTLQHITCNRETGTRSEEMTAFDRHRRLAGRFIDDSKQPMGNLSAQNNGPPVDSAGPGQQGNGWPPKETKIYGKMAILLLFPTTSNDTKKKRREEEKMTTENDWPSLSAP